MHTQRGRVSTPGGGGTPEPTICKPQADFIRNVEGRGSSPGNSASLSRHAPPPTLGQSPTPGITHTPEREDGTLKRTLLCTNPGLFSSVAQSYPPLCDPMDCSTPGLPLHQQLAELTQTHVHWVGNAIQPSHPLSSPSPPAFNLSQHQGIFQWVSSSHQVVKGLDLQLQHQSFQQGSSLSTRLGFCFILRCFPQHVGSPLQYSRFPSSLQMSTKSSLTSSCPPSRRWAQGGPSGPVSAPVHVPGNIPGHPEGTRAHPGSSNWWVW